MSEVTSNIRAINNLLDMCQNLPSTMKVTSLSIAFDIITYQISKLEQELEELYTLRRKVMAEHSILLLEQN